MVNTPTLSNAIALSKLPHPYVAWVQTQLAHGGYLREDQIDGAVGDRTLAAFNAWKNDVFLDKPGIIGQGSIDLLAKLDERNPVSEQQSGLAQRVNAEAGGRSGKEAIIPLIGRVFENEWMDDTFPFFTWGELTKGLTRLPKDEATVRNGLALVKAVGRARAKHGVSWSVTSGYRPRDINKLIGGAQDSTHIYFRGMDVAPANVDFKTMLAIARTTPEIKGIGLGQKKGFLHLDIGWKEGDRRREFSY